MIVGSCGTHGGEEACLVSDSKREGKRPLERPRHRGKDSVKTGLKTGSNGMGETHLAQYGTCWNLLRRLKTVLLP